MVRSKFTFRSNVSIGALENKIDRYRFSKYLIPMTVLSMEPKKKKKKKTIPLEARQCVACMPMHNHVYMLVFRYGLSLADESFTQAKEGFIHWVKLYGQNQHHQ